MRKITSRAVSRLVVLVLAVALSGCGLAQSLQDRMDRRQLQRRFGIPGGAELVSYEGYPSMVGFGQREGLRVDAVYRLTDAQERVFMESSLARDWRTLPIPAAERDRMKGYAGEVPLDSERGVYLARTAGNDVMRAKETVPVSEVDHLADLILGVLDSDTNLLHVRIASGY
jgi:hypothetical protein